MTGLLPIATMTVLSAGIETSGAGATEMPAALTRLNRRVTELLAAHGGERLTSDTTGFIAGFDCAGDALACAVELQRAPLAPVRLRIAVHTGELPAHPAGPAIQRATLLRELAHGGQTLLSAATRELVAAALPPDVWLAEPSGTPADRQPAVQLCHRDLVNDFPPIRPPSDPGFPAPGR